MWESLTYTNPSASSRDKPRTSPHSGPARRPVRIEGVQYESTGHAARALNLSYQTVSTRVRSTLPKWSGWQFLN